MKKTLDEVRQNTAAFKHWHTVNPAIQLCPYEETLGPDLEFLLSEINRRDEVLKEANQLITDGWSVKARDLIREALGEKE